MAAAKPADALRAALKAAGISRNQASVRHEHYSMGSTIRILIRDGKVKRAKVEAIANAFEQVRRDQFGEILSGGNRFVNVDYSSAALQPQREGLLIFLRDLPADGTLVDLGRGYIAHRGGMGREYIIVRDSSGAEVVHCWGNPDFAARLLAEHIANQPEEV